ncbi:MAG: hypothetical protein MJY95_02680 [Bacteroidaceae bacterium]|nr:hypothetical protein [Bacteroidaceae bacterium]
MVNGNYNYDDVHLLGKYLQYVPFEINRHELYNASSLYAGFDLEQPETETTCYDAQVYNHYIKTGKHAYSAKETLARCLHDHGISHALDVFLADYNPRSVVGIMGGHGLLRTDKMFRDIVYISKKLTENGFLMISGGGPGAMEATHLGAWLAGYEDKDVEAALHRLSAAPTFKDEGWLITAFEVIRDYPQTRYRSLGIPTWLYGHEPATPFATHIAKYFDNSIREDGILTIAFGGIIYTPGSAGTMQEIFQDAVQNHYLSFGYASPMIFLGTKFWTEDTPIYPLLQHMLNTGKYQNLLLTLTDDSEQIVQELLKFKNEKLI